MMTLAEYTMRVGSEIGVSAWRVVSQADIDRFADATDDHQFIHVDPVRAKAETPFGGTIAHGFLTVSLLPTLARDALPVLADRVMGINYGFDRIRFITPVKSGARIRARFTLTEVAERRPNEFLLRYGVTVEIEPAGAATKPATAMSADWLTIARVSGHSRHRQR